MPAPTPRTACLLGAIDADGRAQFAVAIASGTRDDRQAAHDAACSLSIHFGPTLGLIQMVRAIDEGEGDGWEATL